MSEKSLIFSMFSKFLDNGEEDETKEREVRPYTEDQKPKAETDQRIETVEDWNDAERTRRERLERELAGENGSEEADHAEDAEAEEDVEAGEDVETGTDRDGGGKSSGEEECRDAGIELTVSDDRMAVSVMLIEPSGGGRDITRERIEQELEAHRIIHGIDEEKVSTIAAEHLYRQMFIIARGTPAVDGNDGRI